MVDKGDFCAGASSAPSRLIHGGLRYLENGEFRLVGESLKERNLLLKNAPHYVKPLPTTVPIFSWLAGIVNAPLRFLGLSKKNTKRGAFIIKVGLTLYDLLARFYRSMPTHHFTSREIVFMAECEDVMHLDDVVLRRTLLGQLDRALLEEIAGILAEALGWSIETTQSEIVRSLRILEMDHGVRLV